MNESFIYLIGATRGTGLEVARILRAAAQPMVALVRSTADISELAFANAKIVRGDVLDRASIEDSIDPILTVRAISSTRPSRPALIVSSSCRRLE